MMPTRRLLYGVVLSSSLRSGLSLDVAINGITCKQDLYITITELSLNCNGSNRCTFGTTADVNGYVNFQNDLDASGLYDAAQAADEQLMYLSGSLSTWSIKYDLMDFFPTSLCNFEAAQDDQGQEDAAAADGAEADAEGGDAAAQDQEADAADAEEAAAEDGGRRRLQDAANAVCPANGVYPLSARYKLPDPSSSAASWLSSGWTVTSELYAYAKSEEEGGANFPLGHCTITLKTYVTPSASTKSALQTPSAAVTLGVVLAALMAAAMLAMYCYCCVKHRKRKFEPTKEGDDITSSFRRMDTTDDGENSNVDEKVT